MRSDPPPPSTDRRMMRHSSSRAVLALSAGGRTRRPLPLFAFDPLLSGAEVDLTALAPQVVDARSRALSGPPGSGKSAYARYLAERLDMEILEKRFSDLSSRFLGESEKAIAAAFEEAACSICSPHFLDHRIRSRRM
jgi:hypothetical protein